MAMGVGALVLLLAGLAIGWFIPRHGPQATTAGAPPVVAAPSLPTAPPEPPLAAAPPSTEPQAERGIRDEDLSALAGAVLAGRAPEAIPERWQAAFRRLEGVLRASDRLNALP